MGDHREDVSGMWLQLRRNTRQNREGGMVGRRSLALCAGWKDFGQHGGVREMGNGAEQTIEERPKGKERKYPGVRANSATSIEIDFRYRNIRCREAVELIPNDKNLRYCSKWKSTIEHEIATNTFEYAKHFPESPKVKLFSRMPGDSLLVGAYLEEWLESEEKKVRHSTFSGYQKILKYSLIPAFGNLALSDLRQSHIYTWTDTYSHSAKRIRNILSPLRIALDAAVKRELITANPLNGFKLGKRKRTGKKNDVDPFSAEERSAILAAIREPQSYNLVQFAFWTGLRTSELVGLSWPDIDWIRGVVVISRVMTQGMDEPEQDAKTDTSYLREVKLLGPALAALTAHTFLKNAEVFQRPRTGERWQGDRHIRESMWIPALKRAGVRYRRPYQTRHTYATMMLMADEKVMWVASQMGHKDWSLTAKRYSRWIPSDSPDAGSKAETNGHHLVTELLQAIEREVPEGGLEPSY
jgi:integrase